MRYGVVIHGPEVIDLGIAAKVLDELETLGDVEATIGGAMGVAALIDAGLEDRVKIKGRQRVSDALVEMDRKNDEVILLNASKTPVSGQTFGQMVVSRVINRLNVPLVQIDDGFYICWKSPLRPVTASLIRSMKLKEAPPSTISKPSPYRRVISGVEIGENVWIDGIVVGKAIDEVVEFRLVKGELAYSGLEPKEHGIEKLSITDLSKALIRSGSVRRTTGAGGESRIRATGNRIILIDHRAEDALFRGHNIKAAVSVGDDTTRIATSLLARLGVPVIGIVDGDEDGICMDREAAEGSIRLVLQPGNDDQLGAIVREKIFRGQDEMIYDGTIGELTSKIKYLAGDKIRSIVR